MAQILTDGRVDFKMLKDETRSSRSQSADGRGVSHVWSDLLQALIIGVSCGVEWRNQELMINSYIYYQKCQFILF